MFGLKKRDEETRIPDRADVNAKRVTLTVILAGLLPFLILWAVYARQFRGVNDVDAIDNAQIARNIQAGRGFVTNVVRPLATANARGVKDVLHMPETVHPPLYPYAESLVLATGPASDFKAFITAALFFVLTIPVLYMLAKNMFSQRAAQLAVLAYTTSVFMTNMVLTGGPGTMTGFMFTLLCLVLYRYAQAGSPEEMKADRRDFLVRAGLCGFVYALCYLTDYMLLFAFLPVAGFMYIAGRQRGRVGLAAFLVVFAVFGGSWMVRNTSLTGNPFFGLRAMEIGMATKAHPGYSLYRSTVPQTVLGLMQETKGDLGKKIVQGIRLAYSSVPVLGQPYLMAFLIAGLFYSFRRTGVNAVRGAFLSSLVFVTVLGSLYLFQLSTLAAFVPVALAFAAAFFIRLLTDSRAADIVSKGVSAIAVILLVMPLGLELLMSSGVQAVPHEMDSDAGRHVKPNVPIVTDRAFQVAWYGSRTTIWLPDTEKDVDNLKRIGCMDAVFLSPGVNPAARTGENYDIWGNMYVNMLLRARQGEFARIDSGSMKGLAVYRGLMPDTAARYIGSGGVLMTSEAGSRPE